MLCSLRLVVVDRLDCERLAGVPRASNPPNRQSSCHPAQKLSATKTELSSEVNERRQVRSRTWHKALAPERRREACCTAERPGVTRRTFMRGHMVASVISMLSDRCLVETAFFHASKAAKPTCPGSCAGPPASRILVRTPDCAIMSGGRMTL